MKQQVLFPFLFFLSAIAFGQATYETVGIIGTATPNDWDASTPLDQEATNEHQWTLTEIALADGEAKFRANDAWDVNWGATDFPNGTGTQEGPNIPIEAGVYSITFDDITGAYAFNKTRDLTVYETVGIIGTATPNGWDASTPLTRDADNEHVWTLSDFSLVAGEAKFRANDAWDVNWGAADFPDGVGVQEGPNIPITAGGYDITFNDITGAYSFVATAGGGGGNAIVTLDPAFPGANEEVVLTYDANEGVSGLAGAEKVYFHSGVIVSGPDGTTWTDVIGNYGQDDGLGQMTPVPGEDNKWQITLPSIRSYYNVPGGQPIFRLGMVFRNADGTLTGKSATDSDIYVDVDPGNYVRWTSPLRDQVFAVANETVSLQATTPSEASSLELFVDQGEGFTSVATQTNDSTITYDYPVTQTESIRAKVVAVIEGDTVENVRELQLAVRPTTTVAELPEGVTNGINYDAADPTRATLVLLAPEKEFVYVVGDFTDWQLDAEYLMNQTPDGEYYWLTVEGLTPQQDYVFQYWVDGVIKVGDPYAHQVADPYNDDAIPEVVYPNLPEYSRTDNGVATVLQTGQVPYEWQNPEVVGGRPDNEDLVIYELLVRDFLASHSYDDLADTLSYLKQLGVNAIELMPIMEFEGNESWGYNPSYALAADKYYGTQEDLKEFIDQAHAEGFVVLLDMVLNHHFGQSPMVRMYWDEVNQRPAENSPWFNPIETHPFNVGYDFNHESLYTKRYVDDVNRYWLEEFEFDGFRFDLSKGFTQNEGKDRTDVAAWGEYDQSRIDILTRMADQIWEVDSSTYVILEHLAVNEEEKVLADYGMMLWGNLNGAYSQAVIGNTEANVDGVIASNRGWNDKNLIGYMESHDEERLMVRALEEGRSDGTYNIQDLETALDRVKLASAFFYTVPGPKMLWQFGELGYDIPIDFNGRTGNKPLPWGAGSLEYYEDSVRQALYQTQAVIINLVNDYPQVFEEGEFSWTPTGQLREITISDENVNVTIVGNFGVTEGSFAPSFQRTGTWYDALSGDTYEVSSTGQSVTLAPGEFHIYLDQPVGEPVAEIEILTPTNLKAVSPDRGKVALTWDDNSTGETGYVVERAWYNLWWPKRYYEVVELPADAGTYTDERVIPGFFYYYRIKTVGETTDSEYGNEALVRVKLRKEIEDFITQLLETIRLYPNPAQGQLTISWQNQGSQELQIRILDMTGQEHRQWTIPSGTSTRSVEADVSTLRTGIYLLEATAGEERVRQKFVVGR